MKKKQATAKIGIGDPQSGGRNAKCNKSLETIQTEQLAAVMSVLRKVRPPLPVLEFATDPPEPVATPGISAVAEPLTVIGGIPVRAQNPAVGTVAPAPGRVARLKCPERPVTFKEWQEQILQQFPALVRPAEVCLSVVGQLLVNDITNPFALALVDVPSSGKTITLNFFNVPELIYTTDNFSPASFVSHASNIKRQELPEVDLLPRIRFRILIARDLATIFGAKQDDLTKTLGILTRVLDGEGLETDSGAHGQRGYQGDYLFMLLAGTTPLPPRAFKIMGNLGSRLFFLCVRSAEKTEDELMAQNQGPTWKQKQICCQAATGQLLRGLWAQNPEGVDWDRTGNSQLCLRTIAQCAKLLACLRGVVHGGHAQPEERLAQHQPLIEHPDRLNCLFYNLARGHALVCGRRALSPADLAPVIEVMLDSAPPVRSCLIRALLDNGGSLRTSQVEQLLHCSKPSALKEMEVLTVLGVTEKSESVPLHGRPEHRLHWRRSCVGLYLPNAKVSAGYRPRHRVEFFNLISGDPWT